MCKDLELKNSGPHSGNCGSKKKNSSMLQRGRESCLHLIIFQLTHELCRHPSSSWTSALNGHKRESQPCARISSSVMSLNQSNCLIPIQEYRRHYSLLKDSQMKAVHSWNVWGSLHKLLFLKKSFFWSHLTIYLKENTFQDFAVTELSTEMELP